MFYRKYRPQTWSDLDNQQIRETLGKAVMANNWSHAYLLLGSRGTGKTTTARLIAKTINCTDRKKGEEPCNKCDSCKAITAGSAMDVIEIDAASNTGVDDIRDLREKVKLAPSSSSHKVYIIDEVHMLSTSAFNALLKTLEEPPEHVVFVLATTDPQKLPDTIISRCLVYDFGKALNTEIKNKLEKIIAKEKIEVSAKVLDQIIKNANGSHRDAQKLLEQTTGSSANQDLERPDALNLIKFLAKRNRDQALKELQKYVDGNGKIKDLISEMISHLRDSLLSQNSEITRTDAITLIKKLIEASTLLRDSPIQSLPVELVIVEWCDKDTLIEKITEEIKPKVAEISGPVEIVEKWTEIVAATKAHNHSLNAFLRAAHPIKLEEDKLTIEVYYKFHKEKLEENKNLDILEAVISDIIGKKLRVNFILSIAKK